MNKITYEDLIKKDKNGIKNQNDTYERLQSNIFLNKKESYDDSNKIINSLNEELLSLKRKMKFVYEKDTEIEKLKQKIIEIGNTNSGSDNKYKNENIALIGINKSLEEKNSEYLSQIEASLFEEKEVDKHNIKYKDELNDLKKQNSLLKKKLYKYENQADIEEDIDTINFDIKPKIEEKIIVDIEKLKKILDTKLKMKKENKIDEIFEKYGIIDKKSVNKDKINKILKEIMLN